jgi:hypothetical protein
MDRLKERIAARIALDEPVAIVVVDLPKRCAFK